MPALAPSASIGPPPSTTYLWLQQPESQPMRSESAMDTLELVITDGAKQASLASDRAPSTLAHQVATALEELGLHKGASRLPMIVGFAVLAHRHGLRLLAEVQRTESSFDSRFTQT